MNTEAWPWSRILPWPAPHGAERRLTLIANPDVRAQVRRDLGLEDVQRLEARIVVRPWLDGVEMAGRVEAVVTRICGLTLEPFEVALDESLEVRIVPPGSPNAPEEQGEIVVDLESADPPDVAPAEGVDPSAYVIETLALALDPFPRKPGASFESPAPEESASPFAALSAFVKRPPPS